MTSEYEDIYSRFYMSVDDYKRQGLDEEVEKEMLAEYLRKTISKPYVRRLFTSITNDSDVEEIDYVMRDSWDDESDKDFVEEMLALGMLEAWLRPRYNSDLVIMQSFTNKEQ